MAKATPLSINLGADLNCEVIEIQPKESVGGKTMGWSGKYRTTIVVDGEEFEVDVTAVVRIPESKNWELGKMTITKATADMLLRMNPKANMEHYNVVD